jgi:hypothetical protein
MLKIQPINVKLCFKKILDALKKEDKYLADNNSSIGGVVPNLKEIGGIYNINENHVQYIVYKALLAIGDYHVYMEDPYSKTNKQCCDITLYSRDWKKSLWIGLR